MAETQQIKNIPDAIRFVLRPETVERLVDMYRAAKDTGDPKVLAAADDAMRYFRDAEAALTHMMAAEATINAFTAR